MLLNLGIQFTMMQRKLVNQSNELVAALENANALTQSNNYANALRRNNIGE